MLTALAYLVVATIRIPVVMFLKYEPKDVIITLAGFIFGPVEAFVIAFVVSLIEMASVSDTGVIGAIMNLVSTSAFVVPAAIFCRKSRTLKGAIIGLISGVVIMVVVMLLWNYILTPIYMGYPREAVAALLVPVFLPFNALKGGLNATITMLIYKPVVTGLRRAHLVPESSHHVSDAASELPAEANSGISVDESKQKDRRKVSGLVVLVSSLLFITFVLLTLVLAGKI